MNKNNRVEILAPAGSFSSLTAAIKAGADSVYFGIGQLNMRSSGAANFSIDDLPKISQICQKNNVKSYLTLNTVVYDTELDQVEKILQQSYKCGISAVIASDLAVILKAREVGLTVHLSTQLSVSNIESVRFFSRFADRIVLARELNLNQIEHIIQEIKNKKISGPSGNLVEVEVFAHGAMCVAVSGRCSMSLCGYNQSANRGQCIQVCRRKFKVIDPETSQELVIDNNYVMSASDLCTIGLLDKLINTGVSCLKIEGRGRPPEYVDTVVKTYREALLDIENNSYTQEKINNYLSKLNNVYNRGLSSGFYLGLKADSWAGVADNKSTVVKTRVGKITKYYSKAKICEIKITDKVCVKAGDSYLITGPTTGAVYGSVSNLKIDNQDRSSSSQGDTITFPVNRKVRAGDILFMITQ